ncbi:PRA1 family protein 3-like [Pollicipes pollicipes]|uniref:PRA1 family protein 3-like n=1 Tax=Pollicipes pollicipes TaxID=41117 RepID=UPI001884C29E|nr:PRA1 family protein 3-like [Pollicipes pollicipes]XP_037093030.1 PRA1 family protein 3-like [Pollicipes pollicipes]XP_037093031.1 PRA1 family protein 3-like [Pollicipes pollicipes]XP_037093032.1 PRA1 family protein 3-like [Pollicipes pollicipes]
MAGVDIEVAPMRSLDDFLANSARFQIPNYRDPDRWAYRVMQNLLYYQTNYFFSAVLIFLLVGMLHPHKFLCGMLALAVVFAIFYYITNKQAVASHFKRDHPLLSLTLIFSGGYFIVYMLGSVLVFLFGICLPLLAVLVHASMRLRNMRNKLMNKMEAAGLKRTPMGLFLDELGVDSDKIVF